MANADTRPGFTAEVVGPFSAAHREEEQKRFMTPQLPCVPHRRKQILLHNAVLAFWRVLRSKSAWMYLIAPEITPTSTCEHTCWWAESRATSDGWGMTGGGRPEDKTNTFQRSRKGDIGCSTVEPPHVPSCRTCPCVNARLLFETRMA